MADLKISSYSIDGEDPIEIEGNQIDEEFDYSEDGFGVITIRIYFEWYDIEDDEEMDNEEDNSYANEHDSITITTNLSFEQRIS